MINISVSMQLLIRHIHTSLVKNKKTLAVAESCTGGLLSYLLTKTPGSSRYFTLGLVLYSNQAKISLLRIPTSLILHRGAVCAEMAKRMSCSVRKISAADYGIGITGLAGPGGAKPGKPIGTVFIAVASQSQNLCQRFHFQGSREQVRKHAALKSLELLKKIL